MCGDWIGKRLALVLSLALVLTACGSGSSGGGGNGEEQPPKADLVITRFNLADNAGATGVIYTASVALKNQGNLEATAFQTSLYLSKDRELSDEDIFWRDIIDPSETALIVISPGQVYGDNDLRIQFPTNVAYGDWYIIVAIDPDNEVEESDETNNVYVHSKLVKLRDGIRPLVVSANPTSGAINVDYGATIEVLFNEPMDPATITDTSFTVGLGGSTRLLSTVTYDAENRKAVLTPAIPLVGGLTFTVSLKEPISDVAGNGLAPVQWTFSSKTHFSGAAGTSASYHMGGKSVLLTTGPNAGKVLVVGGTYSYVPSLGIAIDYEPRVELFDPQTGTFSPAGSFIGPRQLNMTATRLDSGAVLVAGGYDYDDTTGQSQILGTIEIYRAATDAWEAAPDLQYARMYHRATLLSSGQVLITGGFIRDPVTGEVFVLKASELISDSTGGVVVEAGPLTLEFRAGHSAVRLANGQVLIAGGDGPSDRLDSAEIYDPTTNTFTLVSNKMTTPRAYAAGVLLDDGRVLLMGGYDRNGVLKTAEIFDPGTDAVNGSFTPVDSTMYNVRSEFSAVKLANGNVLIVGGFRDQENTADGQRLMPNYVAEIYDVTSGKFMEVDLIDPQYAQGFASAVALPDGRAVVMPGGTTALNKPDQNQPGVYYLRSTKKAYIYQPD